MPVERPRKMRRFSGEIWLGKFLRRQNVQATTENVERSNEEMANNSATKI